MLVGALVGFLGLSALATASPNVQFQTVIDQSDAIAGDFFGGAGQVVVSPAGNVGIVGLLENSGNPIVIYSTPIGVNNWNNQTVAVGGMSYSIPSIPSMENFDDFDNLAITGTPPTGAGTRLTFDAEDVNSNSGILQWDGSSLEDVAFDGDSKGYSSVGGNGTDSGGPLLEMQVNGTGQAMFPAVASSKNVIVRGDSSSLTNIFTPTATLTDNDTGSRVALGSDNSGAALLSSSGTSGIYILPAIPGTPTPIPLGNFTPSTKADPIIGYASNISGGSATLMLVNGTSNGLSTGTPNGTQEIVLSKSGGTPQPILSAFTQPTLHEATEGQMTPNGQIAAYVPNTTGDTIQYANAASANPSASVIASVYSGSGPVSNTAVALDPSGSNLDIEALTTPGSTAGPEINSNGTIIFDAEVGTSPSNEKDALMAWLPGDQSPEILLAAGDTVDIDVNGVLTPEVIDDYNLNSLSNDYDYYKNALNDQNQIAVSVEYAGDTESAVLFANITAVPEPSTIALVSIASAGLLARRRRR
jgi:hypothetical protein